MKCSPGSNNCKVFYNSLGLRTATVFPFVEPGMNARAKCGCDSPHLSDVYKNLRGRRNLRRPKEFGFSLHGRFAMMDQQRNETERQFKLRQFRQIEQETTDPLARRLIGDI